MISQEKLLTQIPTKIPPSEKKPSLLCISILSVLAIAIYALGINESSKIVTDIVETIIEETVQDYLF